MCNQQQYSKRNLIHVLGAITIKDIFLSTFQNPLCFDFTKSKYFVSGLKNYDTRDIQDNGLQIRLDETTSKEICNKYGVMVKNTSLGGLIVVAGSVILS